MIPEHADRPVGQWFPVNSIENPQGKLKIACGHRDEGVEFVGFGSFRSNWELSPDGQRLMKFGVCFRGKGRVDFDVVEEDGTRHSGYECQVDYDPELDVIA